MKRARIAVFVGLCLLFAVAGFVTLNPFAIGRFLEGVDVSNHQGAIDWRTLAQDNVHFAYIKATEGETFRDDRFAINWTEAKAAGLYVGAYHFFTQCRAGIVQADNFLAVLPAKGARVLPPAVDLEHMGPCRKGPAVADVAGEARAFMDHVERQYGVRPIIYTTREFHDAYLRKVRGERFWVRSLFRKPMFRRGDWVIWQHHHRGVKRGVNGPIDLNAFRGDEAALGKFAATPLTDQTKAFTR